MKNEHEGLARRKSISRILTNQYRGKRLFVTFGFFMFKNLTAQPIRPIGFIRVQKTEISRQNEQIIISVQKNDDLFCS